MKARIQIKLMLSLVLVLTPAVANAETGLNGRHVGPYAGGGNPYAAGIGLAPIYKTSESDRVALRQEQSPPALPARPVWAGNLPLDGHSQQFAELAKSPIQLPTQTVAVPPVLQPSVNPPVTLPAVAPVVMQPDVTSPPLTVPRPESNIPTYRSTLQEMVTILGYQGKLSKPFDYLSWYLNGAQVDPKEIVQGGGDWIETAYRHFLADDLLSIWNVTMKDTFLRLIVPFLLAVGLWKIIEFAFAKLFQRDKLHV